MPAKVPDWPDPESPILSSVVGALKSRSKAIKHSVFGWEMEHGVEENSLGTYELISIYFDMCKQGITVILWSDGEIWFCVREFRARRVSFEFSFNGMLLDSSGRDFVKTIEESFAPCAIRASPEQARSDILEVWKAYDPHGDYLKPV